MDKTIKQIADTMKVSKQAVRARINKLPTDCWYIGDNGTIYVTEKGVDLLNNKPTNKDVTKDSSKVDATVDALINQLAIKDKQIEELQKLLSQEQQLNALSQQKIQLLEDKSTKKHWWQR